MSTFAIDTTVRLIKVELHRTLPASTRFFPAASSRALEGRSRYGVPTRVHELLASKSSSLVRTFKMKGRSSRMNANDRLSPDPLGPVERSDGIVQGSHVADVCPQTTIAEALGDLTQLSSIGHDDEVYSPTT